MRSVCGPPRSVLLFASQLLSHSLTSQPLRTPDALRVIDRAQTASYEYQLMLTDDAKSSDKRADDRCTVRLATSARLDSGRAWPAERRRGRPGTELAVRERERSAPRASSPQPRSLSIHPIPSLYSPTTHSTDSTCDRQAVSASPFLPSLHLSRTLARCGSSRALIQLSAFPTKERDTTSPSPTSDKPEQCPVSTMPSSRSFLFGCATGLMGERPLGVAVSGPGAVCCSSVHRPRQTTHRSLRDCTPSRAKRLKDDSQSIVLPAGYAPALAHGRRGFLARRTGRMRVLAGRAVSLPLARTRPLNSAISHYPSVFATRDCATCQWPCCCACWLCGSDRHAGAHVFRIVQLASFCALAVDCEGLARVTPRARPTRPSGGQPRIARARGRLHCIL